MSDFEFAVELLRDGSKRASSDYFNNVGIALWLAGDRQGAIAKFLKAVEGIVDGSIKYADAPGGVSQGLLFWYAAITSHDDARIGIALQYLERFHEARRINIWPGPLSYLVRGVIDERRILELATENPSVQESIAQYSNAAVGVKWNRLIQTLFYLAVQYRARNDESGCVKLLKRCVLSGGPRLDYEWFLAREEISSQLRGPFSSATRPPVT